MQANTIAQFLALIKQRGLAVNNLYMLEIGLPSQLLFSSIRNYLQTEQNDTNKTINNKGLLDGIVNFEKYKTGTKNIMSSLGFDGAVSNKLTNGNYIQFSDIEKICLLCTGAELPFYKQKVNNTFYNNMTRKMVTGIDTDSVNFTFYIDRDNFVLTLFGAWQDIINYNDYEGVFSYKSEYSASEIKISLINKTFNGGLEKFYSTTLLGAFPAHIRPIRVTNGNSELLQLEVTFEFDKIKHETIDLTAQDPLFNNNLFTGFNLLDTKNKIMDAISEGRNMINNVRNDAKSAISNVNDIGKTVKNLFR